MFKLHLKPARKRVARHLFKAGMEDFKQQ